VKQQGCPRVVHTTRNAGREKGELSPVARKVDGEGGGAGESRLIGRRGGLERTCIRQA